MKNLILTLLAITLSGSPFAANAVTVESSTSVYLTFRECVSGKTVCDSISRSKATVLGGLPGDQKASASKEEPALGTSSGRVTLTKVLGESKHIGKVRSLPGARNGGNSLSLQKYTNSSSTTEMVTFEGVLTFEQTVPEENADFPANGASMSGAGAELGIIQFNVDAIEAGITDEDNFEILMEGPKLDDDVVVNELGFDRTGDLTNISESGSKTASVEAIVNPGDTIWLWVIVQNLSANGAEVTSSFITELHID